MLERREFRRTYLSTNRRDRFMQGDIATIIEKRKSEVKFKVSGTQYLLPIRDFIIVTKPIN